MMAAVVEPVGLYANCLRRVRLVTWWWIENGGVDVLPD